LFGMENVALWHSLLHRDRLCITCISGRKELIMSEDAWEYVMVAIALFLAWLAWTFLTPGCCAF
jgi:hypothetical protein